MPRKAVAFIYPGVKVTESIDVERTMETRMDAIAVNLCDLLSPNENGWRDSRRPDRKMDETAAAPLID